MFVIRWIQKEGNSMELVKSKGLVIFLVVMLSITVVSSINTRKFDERNKDIEKSYISMNIK